jgi:2-phosphosulfolactate phosphatase
MHIERLSLLQGAERARGLVVIIDVLRAATTAAYALDLGAERIIPTDSVEEALRLRELHPEWLLMGERGGRRLEGFDLGNSPWELRSRELKGRTIIHATSSGTRGITHALGNAEVLFAAFVNAEPTARYISWKQPKRVSLVAMGEEALRPALEDELCAQYIEALLRGGRPNFNEMKKRILSAPSSSKFFDPRQPQYHPEDLEMALQLDRFSFVMKVERGYLPYIVRVYPP